MPQGPETLRDDALQQRRASFNQCGATTLGVAVGACRQQREGIELSPFTFHLAPCPYLLKNCGAFDRFFQAKAAIPPI